MLHPLDDKSVMCMYLIWIILLMLSLAFPRGRLCENVLEGSSHHHVLAQGSSGQLLPGGQSWPTLQQAQTGLGVSFRCSFPLWLWRELTDIRIIANVFRCWFSGRRCSCPGLSCSCPAGTQLVSGSGIWFVLSVFHLLVEGCNRY